MSRTTVCYLVSSSTKVRRTMTDLVAELGYDFRHLPDVQSVNVESMLSSLSGCIIVDADSQSNGISELTSLFVQQRVSMPIIVTSCYEDASKRLQHVRQGAFDTLRIPDESDRVHDVLRGAMERDVAGEFSSSAMRIKLAMLTARERETIGLFLDGHNTKIVAKALDITYQTVDKHRGRALRKIGLKTVVELFNQIQLAMLHSMGVDLGLSPRIPLSPSLVPLPHFTLPPDGNTRAAPTV